MGHPSASGAIFNPYPKMYFMLSTQRCVVVDFVKESWCSLKAADNGAILANNFLLFLVPKPGQSGQYCCIADGLWGGQNDNCVLDPTVMTSPQHMVPAPSLLWWLVGVPGHVKVFPYFSSLLRRIAVPGTHTPWHCRALFLQMFGNGYLQ